MKMYVIQDQHNCIVGIYTSRREALQQLFKHGFEGESLGCYRNKGLNELNTLNAVEVNQPMELSKEHIYSYSQQNDYNEYFEQCELYNKIPLTFDQWSKDNGKNPRFNNR